MDDAQKKVLSAILSYGQIRGFELKKICGMPDDALTNAVSPLINMGLVAASGIVSPETLDRVQFAPLSSAFERSSSLLQ